MNKFLFILFLSVFATNAYAQRYCYVDTKYILDNMPEYAAAQKELNQVSEKWQKEIVTRYEAIENMRKAYQAERVLLTPDMKRQREDEIAQAEKEAKELQKKRFSLNGDLFRKREELIKPVQDEIYRALVELAESGNYMVIFDKSNESSIIFASPKYDKSDRILKKLGIKPGQSVETKDDDSRNSENKNTRTNTNQNNAPAKSGGTDFKKG
ncbi:MAG: OmpH family outer membrane protein [Bacteroidetes bacterium]|nr:MAG: OmpH family outer membrane protein [Bacteroidota bacterium]